MTIFDDAVNLLAKYSPPWDTNNLAQTVARALLALAAGGGAVTAPVTSFVFQPGGTAGGNVYTSWAPLVAAARPVQGRRLVVIDTTFGAATIPTAVGQPGNVWDFGAPQTDVDFIGVSSNGVNLTIADGCVFAGISGDFARINITFQGNTPAIPVGAGQIFLLHLHTNASLRCTGTSEFALATSTGFLSVFIQDFSLLFGAGFALGASGAAAGLTVLVDDAVNITANTIRAAGGAALSVQIGGSSTNVNATQSPALVQGSNLTLGRALNVGVVDTAGNVYGATQLQSMIDAIKLRISGTVVNIADAAATSINIGQGRWRYITAVSQNTTITCDLTGSPVEGDEIQITRGTNEAFFVSVTNSAGTELARLAASTRGAVRVHFLLGQWVLKDAGACS